jgi:RNA polymerase sigma-70 factor (ECF subfamily)
MLERAEREALLREAIERLTPASRIVLQLRDWEDMSYDEIADVLAVPVGTVRSRLHNARARLAQELAMRVKRS